MTAIVVGVEMLCKNGGSQRSDFKLMKKLSSGWRKGSPQLASFKKKNNYFFDKTFVAVLFKKGGEQHKISIITGKILMPVIRCQSVSFRTADVPLSV